MKVLNSVKSCPKTLINPKIPRGWEDITGLFFKTGCGFAQITKVQASLLFLFDYYWS